MQIPTDLEHRYVVMLLCLGIAALLTASPLSYYFHDQKRELVVVERYVDLTMASRKFVSSHYMMMQK